MIQVGGHLTGVGVGQWHRWKLELVLDLTWVVQIDLVVREGLHLPLVFVVEVHRLRFRVLASGILSSLVNVDPSLEPNVEVPTSPLQFLSSQVLLVGVLKEVEVEEQSFIIKPLEVTLPVVQSLGWEILVLVLVVVHYWALWFSLLILVLQQRDVDERTVEHFVEHVLVWDVSLSFVLETRYVQVGEVLAKLVKA